MRTTAKRLLCGLAATTLAITAVACGDDDEPEGAGDTTGTEAGGESTAQPGATSDAGTDTTAASGATTGASGAAPGDYPPMKVAVVLPSTAEDFGISRGIVRAMELIREERGGEENFELAFSENMFVVDDAATAIRDYASRGFDVVLATSSAYGSSIAEIAPEFPEVSFIWGTNPDTLDQPNVYAFAARSEQAGYVGGLVAGMLADTVGFVAPIDVGSIAGSVDGFGAGVEAAGGGRVLENFTNSFSDATLASAAADTMVSSGAGVLASQTEMAVGVASVAENSDGEVGFIGFDSDFQPAAPTATILSLDFRYEQALRPALEQIDDGKLGGDIFYIDFANGGIDPVWNDGREIPEDVRTAGDEAVEQISSGELDVTTLIEG